MMASTNREYSAFISDNKLYVTELASPGDSTECLPCPGGTEGRYSALALSQGQSNLLAVACASQIYIIDLKTRCCKQIFAGIGRVVTALAFPHNKACTIATGHVDGSICIWHLWRPGIPAELPPLRLLPASPSCNFLAFNPKYPTILASVGDDQCHIWNLDHSTTRPTYLLDRRWTPIASLAWCPLEPDRLVLSYTDGELRLFELLEIHQSAPISKTSKPTSGADDETIVCPNCKYDVMHPFSGFDLGITLNSIAWTGASAFMGLTHEGRECFLLALTGNCMSPKRAWSCSFENAVKSFDLQTEKGETTVLGIEEDGVENHVIPHDICKDLSLDDRLVHSRPTSSHENENHFQPLSKVTSNSDQTMSPVPLSSLRIPDSSFSKTSRQLQTARERKLSRSWTSTTKGVSEEDGDVGRKGPPSMTSSLELPILTTREDVISPMPFLSPGIPAREISFAEPGYFEAETSLKPMLLPQPSMQQLTATDSATLAVPDQDSEDSDDESYADNLQGSTIFLPGGVNVPLPKACGALFHPNGQLLTFFPTKQQQITPSGNEAGTDVRQKKAKGNRVIKLFPSFGNLENSWLTDESSSNESIEVIEKASKSASQAHEPSTRPTRTVVQPLSNLEPLGIPSIHGHELSQSKLVVRVYEIDEFQLLSPALSLVAQDYRILCKDNESGAQLCVHNAEVARKSGLDEVAQAWWIISKLLEDRVPLLDGSLNDGVWRVAQQMQLLALDELDAAILLADLGDFEASGKLRWADHPFGGTWLIRRVLDWAESRADVQFLACAASILSQTDTRVPSTNPTAEQSMLSHLPTHSLHYLTSAYDASNAAVKPATPVLRTQAASISNSSDSPTKRLPSAPSMSRSSSQMATPALESNGIPPWSFSLTRQSTNLSTTTGSASPETQRGSFGTPSQRNQSYAQSISEKAALFYNWSPTTNKGEGASSANGALSSSLPNGSWAGKSVSFASSTYTDDTRGNPWSSIPRLLTRDDDNDSDKTVEDSSTPHTPKSPIGGPGYVLSNTDMFADEASGSARSKLIAGDLEHASRVWCEYYADLLRSWDMHAKATELEKAIGLTFSIGQQEHAPDERGVQPLFRDGWRKSRCIICDTMANGIVQTCPGCLHISHFSCASVFFAELGEAAYSCPSGCGCSCSELPFVVQEIVQPQAESPRASLMRKKPSFTDPRRWRARVEGDSW